MFEKGHGTIVLKDSRHPVLEQLDRHVYIGSMSTYADGVCSARVWACLYRLHIGIADGVASARVWACRYS